MQPARSRDEKGAAVMRKTRKRGRRWRRKRRNTDKTGWGQGEGGERRKKGEKREGRSWKGCWTPLDFPKLYPSFCSRFSMEGQLHTRDAVVSHGSWARGCGEGKPSLRPRVPQIRP